MITHNIEIVSALVGGLIVGVLITMAAFAMLATYDDEPSIEQEDEPTIMPIVEPVKHRHKAYNQETDYSFGGIAFSRKK